MEEFLKISQLNDFIFCPLSIYFHGLYDGLDKIIYQREAQLAGTEAHKAIEDKSYSTRKGCLMNIEVFSQKYNLIGKIDIFDSETKTLTERKNIIKKVYDGYVFQLYAEYFALREMGIDVQHIKFYSMKDNKSYPISLPEHDEVMLNKFEQLLKDIRTFDMKDFRQNNADKCRNCIYEPMCDKSCLL